MTASGMSAEEVANELSTQVSEFQGEKLETPVPYSWDCDQYENLTEAQGSEDWPGDNEILKMVNRSKLTAAKQAAYQKATKKLREDYEKTPEARRKAFIAIAVQSGFSKDEAEALALQRIK